MILEDDGFMNVTIADVTVRLDVFHVNNKICELVAKCKDKSLSDFHDAVVALMTTLGLPPGSHRLAALFIDAITDRVADLKKKPSPSPESPDSTASIPSNSPGCS